MSATSARGCWARASGSALQTAEHEQGRQRRRVLRSSESSCQTTTAASRRCGDTTEGSLVIVWTCTGRAPTMDFSGTSVGSYKCTVHMRPLVSSEYALSSCLSVAAGHCSAHVRPHMRCPAAICENRCAPVRGVSLTE